VACQVMPPSDAPFRDWRFPQRSPRPTPGAWTDMAIQALAVLRPTGRSDDRTVPEASATRQPSSSCLYGAPRNKDQVHASIHPDLLMSGQSIMRSRKS
jgi:hypothetical protein